MARSNWDGLDSEEWSELFGVDRAQSDTPPEPTPSNAQDLPPEAVGYWNSLTARQRSIYLAEAQDAAASEDPPLSKNEIVQTAILFAWQDAATSAPRNPSNRPVSTNRPPPAANKSKTGMSWLRALALLGGLAFIVFIVLPLVAGDEDSRDSSTSTPTPSTALAERRTGAARAWASTPLSPSVSVKVNAGYHAVSQAAADRALGRVVGWYRSVWGLEARRRVEVQLEPTCVAPFVGEVDGYAQLEFEQVLICARLDANAPAALHESDFRDVLAHEYYHAIQYNAPWSGVDALADCPRFLTEGAASFFGQLYASGAVDDGGLGDVLDVLFDTDRWWHYEEGARAFEALVNRFGDAAVRFWQTDERACADAFLLAFGMSPTRWEENWRDW